MTQTLPTTARPPWRRRIGVHLTVTAARLLIHLPPHRLRATLMLLRRGATPATRDQARAAHRDVVATSVHCAGRYCLPRSVAIALLCRLRGTWPTWCTGVRTPPFAAHAWVAVDGEPVEEPADTEHYHLMLSVPPA